MSALDIPANVPATVSVSFPRIDQGILSASRYQIQVALNDLALTEYPTNSGHTGVHLMRSSAVASLNDGYGTAIIILLPMVDVASNDAELLTLAKRMATDFYLWRIASLEIRYESAVDWTADGMHDVEWSCDEQKGIVTSVHRSEWEPEMADLEHYGTAGSSAPYPEAGEAETVTTSTFTAPAIGASVTVPVVSTGWIQPGQEVVVYDGVNRVYGFAVPIDATSFTLYVNLITDGAAGNIVLKGALVLPGPSPLRMPTTASFTLPAVGTGVTVNVKTTGPYKNYDTATISDGTNIVVGFITSITATSFTFTPIYFYGGSAGNTMAIYAVVLVCCKSANPLFGVPSPATTATQGFPWWPLMNGIPTGTPSPNFGSGLIPVVPDKKGRLFWGYHPDDAAWMPMGVLHPIAKTTTYTARSRDYVHCDTATGFTVSLPASPQINDVVGVKKTSSDSNTLTLSGNGNTIDGAASWTTTTQYAGVQVMWNGTAWLIVAVASSTGGSGITSLNGLTGATQTFANDTNVTMVSSGTTHTLTWAGTLATARIADDAVTYAKMQNISATSRILGRKTASAGDTEECTLSEVLDFIGSAAQGDILYRGASAWARLGAGTSGYFLKTNGASANPEWAAASASRTEGTLAATGSTQGDAAAITTDAVHVTGADGTKGVILPNTAAAIIIVKNEALLSSLKVYPNSGASIGSGAANAAHTMSGSTYYMYTRTSSTQWVLKQMDLA